MRKKRKIWTDIKIVTDLIAVVLLWRGVWSLLDMYFFPNNPVISNIIGIILGLALLLIDDFALKELESHDRR